VITRLVAGAVWRLAKPDACIGLTLAGKDFFLPDDSAALDLLKTAFTFKTVFFFVFRLRF